MDIFDSAYYRINKNLHRCLGSWPYQPRYEKYCIRFIILCLNISMVIPEVLNLIYVRNDLNMVIDSMPIFITHIIHVAKYSTHIFNGDEMMELLNIIKQNWEMVNTEWERIIMHQYAETGRKISLGTIVVYFVSSTIYVITPITPRILDAWHPLNESRPYVFIIKTEYAIDHEKYYALICLHHCAFATIAITTLIATDATYGVYAHHVCGMFAIVRNQLENMPFSVKSSSKFVSIKTENFKVIVNCIEKHKNAIRFCDIMESAHVGLLFVVLLTSVTSLSVTGVQTITYLDQPLQALRFATLCMTHFVHIYYYSWNSQNILNHSKAIHGAAYNAKWYAVLDKSTKLLTFIMLRSSKPCIQTAGKLFPMTLINFTLIVKSSMSYFTLLTNFQ